MRPGGPHRPFGDEPYCAVFNKKQSASETAGQGNPRETRRSAAHESQAHRHVFEAIQESYFRLEKWAARGGTLTLCESGRSGPPGVPVDAGEPADLAVATG
jgi:hypothetical protein